MVKKKTKPKMKSKPILFEDRLKYPSVVLSCDPGTSNFGLAIQSFSRRKALPKLLHSSPFTRTIVNLTESEQVKKSRSKKKSVEPTIYPSYTESRKYFYDSFSTMIKKFKVTTLVAERFQARGLMGSTVEAVSTMNAILAILADEEDLPCRFVIAGQWKNSIARLYGKEFLPSIYKRGQQYGITPHTIDARLIGVYHMSLPFDLVLGNDTKVTKFLKEMQ